MSPPTYFAILALASQVFAIPHAGLHGHAAHQRAHRREAPAGYGSSSSSVAAAVPYPMTNVTTSRNSELSPQSPTLIPTGYSSSTSVADAKPTAYDSSSSEADAVPATSQSSAANGLPTYHGSSSGDITATTTIRQTSTTTSYTTTYLSSTGASQQAPASSIADSNSASAYKEVKQVSANTANSNGAASTDAEQCGAVTVTATEKVTEYITVSPSSTAVAAVTGGSSAASSSIVSAGTTSALFPANSTTQYAPTAYSSASYSAPALSKNSSEAGAIPATSAPAYALPSSSSEAAAVPTSAPSAPAYGTTSASSEAAAVSTSASSAPVYSAPISSSFSEAAPVSTSKSSATTAAIIATAYENKGLVDAVATWSASAPVYQSSVASSSTSAAASQSSVASSSTSAAASQSSVASSSGGKRGLAYNDASLTDCFTGGSEITWAYNWGSSAGDLASGLNFIPTLWGTGSDFTGSWSENAKSAISSGSTTLFSFNEPDLPAQANLSPAAAAAAYKTYMQPLAGSAKLCAPSVTNSGTDGQGLSWLSEFLDACSDCQIDCINIHWYDSAENTAYFKSHIEDATTVANGKPIYVSEFGATGSDEQISSFLQEVMPYMDSNSNIAGYAYFMVESGVLVTGTEPSTYGTVYKSYTS